MTRTFRKIILFIILLQLATIAVWIFVPSELIVNSDTYQNQFVLSARQDVIAFLGCPEVCREIVSNSYAKMVDLKCQWPLLNLYNIGLLPARGKPIVFSLQSYNVNEPVFWIFEDGYFYESDAAPDFLPYSEVKR